MYNSEQFLTSANNYLNSPISKKFFKELKLKKADSFLVEKEKPAAAVTAGIALEHHLRDLCDKNGLQTTKIINSSGKEEFKKASRLNGELYSQKEAYPKSYLDNISAWLGIRNDAAHGNDENYTEEQVRLMIMGITHFMNNYPS